MNKYVRPALALLFLYLAAALPACGTREKSQIEPASVPETRIVRVTGWLRGVAGETGAVVISTPDGEWLVPWEELYKLTNLKDGVRTVTVEGEGTVTDWRLVGGQSAGMHRILKNITVISIETYDGVMLPVPYDIDWGGIFGWNFLRGSRFLYIGNVQVAGAGGADGSGPVPKLVMPWGERNIASGEQHKLAGLQNRTVAVAAIQTATKGKAADGSVIEIIILSDIVIIAVSEPEDTNE